MGPFRRKKSEEPGRSLVPTVQSQSHDGGYASDGWQDARIIGANSGKWVVIRMSTLWREGDMGRIEKSMTCEADDGIEAIKKLYDRDYDINNENEANGRYVALDFYGGERTEALVTGEWRVKIDVAPERLGA